MKKEKKLPLKQVPDNSAEEIHRDTTNGRDEGNETENYLDGDLNRPMRDNDSDTLNGRIRFGDSDDGDKPELTEKGKEESGKK
ncbi:MAG: hypothetical protein H7Y04_01955 [Verrucomicrobia bacterium]|nr:hypothetical protein [Cytophagales bacterium]